jgi:putative endonuclease
MSTEARVHSSERRWTAKILEESNTFAFDNGRMLAQPAVMSKRFVYVIRNNESPPRYYAGVTSDVARRHVKHNTGNCTHTAKYRPWSIDVVVEFAERATRFRF